MREIKFRAWDEKEKCWVCGFAIHQNGMFSDWAGCKEVNGKCYADANWEQLKNIPHIKIMQYTGKKDKNGREIYEGDLLQHPNGTIAEIKYSDDLAAFVAVYVRDGNTEMDYLDKEIVSKCKIVGNIYENPELLEVEEEMNAICPTCNGSGGIDMFEDSIGEIVTVPCSDCGGSGVSDD